MCLILYVPAHTSIPPEWAAASKENNPDGFGAMWLAKHGGQWRVVTHKTMDAPTAPGLSREYRGIFEQPFALHWRKRTKGEITTANAHPHKIMSIEEGDEADVYYMHNGTMKGSWYDAASPLSDSRQFAEKVLRPIYLNSGGMPTPLLEELFRKIGGRHCVLSSSHEKFMLYGDWQTKPPYVGAVNSISLSNLHSISYTRYNKWDERKWDDYGGYGGYYHNNNNKTTTPVTKTKTPPMAMVGTTADYGKARRIASAWMANAQSRDARLPYAINGIVRSLLDEGNKLPPQMLVEKIATTMVAAINFVVRDLP